MAENSKLRKNSLYRPIVGGTSSHNTPATLTWDVSHRSQLNSPLLRLPREIRDMIYSHVLGTGIVAMSLVNAYRARLSMLSTCKQIHIEAHILPFKLNMFRFSSGFEYAYFVAVTTTAQRSPVSSLQLDVTCRSFEFECVFHDIVWTRQQHAYLLEDEVSFKATFPALRNVVFEIQDQSEVDIDIEAKEMMGWVKGLNRDVLAVTYNVL